MIRIFTMRKCCLNCGRGFTITSAASKFCKREDCIKDRREQAYREQKARAAIHPLPAVGSDAHLARALRTGE